jgi:uncharacterized membrane protein
LNNRTLGLIAVVIVALINVGLGLGWYHANAGLAIFGILLVLVVPGYLLSHLMLPSLPIEERILLSLGLSVVTAGLLGLLLNFTPWGLSVSTWGVGLGLLALLGAGALFFRWRRSTGGAGLPGGVGLKLTWRPAVLYSAALLVILLAFYILKLDSAQLNTPLTSLWANYDPGNSVVLNIGIQNQEGKATTYNLVVESNNVIFSNWTGIYLDHDKLYTRQLALTQIPRGPVKVLLYLADNPTQIYRQVNIALPAKPVQTQGK